MYTVFGFCHLLWGFISNFDLSGFSVRALRTFLEHFHADETNRRVFRTLSKIHDDFFFCESSYRFLLRKKCPYSDLFWSSFSRIQSKCRKMLTRITPNTDTLHALVLVVKTPLEMFDKVLNTSLIVDFSK